MIGSAIAMLLLQAEFGKQENASDATPGKPLLGQLEDAERTREAVSGLDAIQAQRDPPPR
jgi:hypothetical protein